MKTLQHFSDAYLAQCQRMNSLQIVMFLEDFRAMIAGQSARPQIKLKPICIKMPEDLLLALKRRAKKKGIPYQTLIKAILSRECPEVPGTSTGYLP